MRKEYIYLKYDNASSYSNGLLGTNGEGECIIKINAFKKLELFANGYRGEHLNLNDGEKEYIGIKEIEFLTKTEMIQKTYKINNKRKKNLERGG